jgi:hypothetical protein
LLYLLFWKDERAVDWIIRKCINLPEQKVKSVFSYSYVLPTKSPPRVGASKSRSILIGNWKYYRPFQAVCFGWSSMKKKERNFYGFTLKCQILLYLLVVEVFVCFGLSVNRIINKSNVFCFSLLKKFWSSCCIFNIRVEDCRSFLRKSLWWNWDNRKKQLFDKTKWVRAHVGTFETLLMFNPQKQSNSKAERNKKC